MVKLADVTTINWEALFAWATAVVVPIVVAYISNKRAKKEDAADKANVLEQAKAVESYASTVKQMSDAYNDNQIRVTNLFNDLEAMKRIVAELKDKVQDLIFANTLLNTENTELHIELGKLQCVVDERTAENVSQKLKITAMEKDMEVLKNGVRDLITQLKAHDIVPVFNIDDSQV